MKKLFALFTMCFLGMGLTSACFVVDVDECSSSTFDEYCTIYGETVQCIGGEIVTSYCGSGYTCVEYDEYNDRAECVPDVIPCNPSTFDEYCVGDTPVWCIDGIEQYAGTCNPGSICVEFKKGYDRAECVIPEYDEYGGDICDYYEDVDVNISRCFDGYTYIYECAATNTNYDYWKVIDSYQCSYGCHYDGISCY